MLLETLEDLETRSQVGGGVGQSEEGKIAEKTSGVRGMLAKPSQQDSYSEWPGRSDTSQGTVQHEEPDWMLRVTKD